MGSLTLPLKRGLYILTASSPATWCQECGYGEDGVGRIGDARTTASIGSQRGKEEIQIAAVIRMLKYSAFY